MVSVGFVDEDGMGGLGLCGGGGYVIGRGGREGGIGGVGGVSGGDMGGGKGERWLGGGRVEEEIKLVEEVWGEGRGEGGGGEVMKVYMCGEGREERGGCLGEGYEY